MTTAPHDISQNEAIEMLDWLIAMGADEIVQDTPMVRLDTAVQAVPAEMKRPIQAAPILKNAASSTLSEDQSLADIAAAANSIEALRDAVSAYKGSGLATSASHCCFLGGNLTSRILVIGDRPRNDEEREGTVFAGKTFVLLQAMLKAIGLDIEIDVMLANVVPWRPAGNRQPNEIEIKQCVPLIVRVVELAQPHVILGLGGLAGQALAGAGGAVISQRAQWLAVGDIPFASTFHPEELLRSPARKKLAWRDLVMFKMKLDQL